MTFTPRRNLSSIYHTAREDILCCSEGEFLAFNSCVFRSLRNGLMVLHESIAKMQGHCWWRRNRFKEKIEGNSKIRTLR